MEKIKKNRGGSHPRKYDWIALKIEFLKGPWLTLADFYRYKGMSTNNSDLKLHAKGWLDEKAKIKKMALEKATKDLVEDEANNIKLVMERQANDARFLQEKGKQGLEKLVPETSEDARKLWVTGVEQERNAIKFANEIKGGGEKGSSTTVNIKLPKTRLDELIDGLDYSGTLRLIAELKRARAGGAGKSSEGQGAAEAQQGA